MKYLQKMGVKSLTLLLLTIYSLAGKMAIIFMNYLCGGLAFDTKSSSMPLGNVNENVENRIEAITVVCCGGKTTKSEVVFRKLHYFYRCKYHISCSFDLIEKKLLFIQYRFQVFVV